jgi:hypothetical protein
LRLPEVVSGAKGMPGYNRLIVKGEFFETVNEAVRLMQQYDKMTFFVIIG